MKTICSFEHLQVSQKAKGDTAYEPLRKVISHVRRLLVSVEFLRAPNPQKRHVVPRPSINLAV